MVFWHEVSRQTLAVLTDSRYITSFCLLKRVSVVLYGLFTTLTKTVILELILDS